MWAVFLVGLVVAAGLHARSVEHPSRRKTAELILVYLLAGYCGIAQIVLGLSALIASPAWLLPHMPKVLEGSTMMTWAAFLWIGMGAVGTLTIWIRGAFLAAPAIAWSIFWLGATYAHVIHDEISGWRNLAMVVFVHGFVAVLMLGSGAVLWRATNSR